MKSKYHCSICGVQMYKPWKSGVCTHCSFHLGAGYTEEEIKKMLKEKKRKTIVLVDADELEHLLNCMDNQKFIHEQSEETQKEWQDVIDKANHNMRKRLSEAIRND